MNISLRAMVLSAAMGALALVLPVAFHAAGLGSEFLPMLLPLLLNGFLAPFPWAVSTGLLIPWISAFAIGMPPLYPPVAAVVSVEAAVMAGLASLLWRFSGQNVWIALVPAVIVGRLVAFALTWSLAQVFDLPPALASVTQILQGLPGVALQLAVIPVVVRLLRKRGGLLMEETPE